MTVASAARGLSREQRAIRDTARDFLTSAVSSEDLRDARILEQGFDPKVWRRIVKLGWPTLCLPEAADGLEFGQLERALLMEEMGRVLLPSPFLSSCVMASDAVMLTAQNDDGEELLTRLGQGQERAALVAAGDLHSDPSIAHDVRAESHRSAWSLTGEASIVLDGGSATTLVVVAARADGTPAVYSVTADAEGVERSSVELIDRTRRFAKLRFSASPALLLSDPGLDVASAIDDALTRATVALSAEMVGAAQRCLDRTLDYVKQRTQFEVPIASFQAIKHRAASLAIAIEAAREAVLFAAERLDAEDESAAHLLASTAKLAASETFESVTDAAIQMHGGVGFTDVDDSHLYFKRARVATRMLGSPHHHRQRVADLIGV